MLRRQTPTYFAVRIMLVMATLFAGLFLSVKDTYAEATEVSTPEEFQSYLSSGGEIKLVADITLSEATFVRGDMTIDLNGHTLDMSDKTLVPYESTLTVEDNSVDKAGKITSTSSFTIQVGASSSKIGTFILNSGTIDCRGAYCIYNNDNLVINGGTVNGDDYVIYNMKNFTMNGGAINAAEIAAGNYAEGATIVINDGAITSNTDDYIAVVISKPNTSFTMNGGSITAVQQNEDGSDGGVAIAAFKYTEVTINGGTINAYSNAIASNGSASGSSEGTSAKFNVNGGSITSTTGAGIYAPQINGITTITGGVITGETGIEIRSGTLNISGGTIVATAEYEVKPETNGLTTRGAAISAAQHSTAQPITINIKGGEFKGVYPISNANPLNHEQAIFDQVVINVQGGEYTGDDLDDVIKNIPRGYSDVDVSEDGRTITVVPTNPAGYYISAKTSGLIDIRGYNETTPMDYSDVNVISNCREGYDMTMSSTVNDSTLYLDSDSASPYSISSVADNTSLTVPNTWGYLMVNDSSVPTGKNLFHPVPSLSSGPDILRTTSGTASDSDINDKFRLYFGANLGKDLINGRYEMEPDTTGTSGSIVYQITASPTCTTFPVEVTFNKNLDGEGGEEAESSVSNFPISWENIFGTNEHGDTTLRLSDRVPIRDDYLFVEWNTESDGSGTSYYPDDVVTVGTGDGELYGEVTLYAIWKDGCHGGTICYDGNGEDEGEMENQTGTPGLGVALQAPNYSRAGYGFAGWNTKPDGSGINYGPNQNIAIPQSGGIYLYANWVPSAGSLQTWTGASSMNVGDITALTDDRDGETYVVAKLADGNVWTVENLRLVPSTANITMFNTNHPTAGFVGAASSSSSVVSFCKNNDSDCVDTIAYNTNNIDRSLTPSPDANNNASSWYSYGVVYNWYTATAGNGTYDMASGTAAGDICPAGWHLPTGDNGEFVNFTNAIGGITNDANIRVYPNNFTRSGNYDGDTTDGRGSHGRFWSATASEKNKSYRFGYNSSSLTPNNTYNKWDAFSIRCIYDGNRVSASEVTVNLGEHVDAVTISNETYGTRQITTSGDTITVANNLPYTITATFETGYTIDTWTTTNGQIDSATSVSTAYTVTDTATLGIVAKVATQTTYTLNYDTGASSDVIPSDAATSYDASYTFDITDSVPAIIGFSFIGWSEDSSAATVDYSKDDTITLINSDPDTMSAVTKTLYAVYQEDTCPAGNICYFGNGADSGTMSNQTDLGSSVNLIAPNYAKNGFGFAGWITSEDATPYGPNESITVPDVSGAGLKLYAKWVASSGEFQSWNECGMMNIGDVTALTDSRDGNTYLVAKLADNNCWLAENLRINPATANITAQNTNSPTVDFLAKAPNSSSAKTLCTTTGSDCEDKLQYNLNSLNRSLTQSHNSNGNSVAWYAYGGYYNWYTATAGNGFHSTIGDSAGDICPAGWKIPTGNTNGEYNALNTALNNGATNNDVAWRKYPNNFIYSGEYKGSSRDNGYSQTRAWTATAKDANNAFRLGLKSGEVTAKSNAYNKWEGFVVRCIRKNQ